MKYNNIPITLILTIALCLSNIQTQAFDLFEKDRGKPPPPPPRPIISAKRQAQLPNPFRLRQQERKTQKSRKPLPPQKDFLLRGTSRIGDKRMAILKGPDNKDFIQSLKDNVRTEIKHNKYQGYYLLSVEAREVQIEYPTESPCRKSNEEKGLECSQTDEGKTAILSLKRRKALPSPKKPPPVSKKQKKRDQKKRQQQYKGFKRKVIKDEEVPPGMRVVRTPFGDRLVPKK